VVILTGLLSPCPIMLAIRLAAARCMSHTRKAQQRINTLFYIVVYACPAFFFALPSRPVPVIPLP
jgi:hypothetical protein